MKQDSGRHDDALANDETRRIEMQEARAEVDRDEARLREERHRADGWSLRQFRARGWTGAALVALFGGIAALVPYYSALVLLVTVAVTIATLLAWLLISLRSRRYTPPLSVHLSSLVFIFVALALLSVSVGANRPGSGVGARLLGLAGVAFAAAAVVGWLRPSRRVHHGPMFGVILAVGLCLAAFLKLLSRDFVTRYVMAVLGLVVVAAIGTRGCRSSSAGGPARHRGNPCTSFALFLRTDSHVGTPCESTLLPGGRRAARMVKR